MAIIPVRASLYSIVVLQVLLEDFSRPDSTNRRAGALLKRNSELVTTAARRFTF
jgi:hypothetical protein